MPILIEGSSQLSLSVLSQTFNAQVILTVGEVFHRFATVWTSMNCTAAITSALYSAHMVWKNRGMQVRSLLALLVQMDAGRHLDASARLQINTDITSFAHVSSLVRHMDSFSLVFRHWLLALIVPNMYQPSFRRFCY